MRSTANVAIAASCFGNRCQSRISPRVLSKVFVPLAILPVLTFVIVIVTQFIMLLLSTAVLLPSGLAGTTWNLLPWPRLSMILLYGLVTSALWEAPIFAWLLLVSSWAKRATFLWAVLPWLAISAIEKLAFDTTFFIRMLVGRLTGGFEAGFVVVKYPKDAHVPVVDRLTQFDPLKFLSSPVSGSGWSSPRLSIAPSVFAVLADRSNHKGLANEQDRAYRIGPRIRPDQQTSEIPAPA